MTVLAVALGLAFLAPAWAALPDSPPVQTWPPHQAAIEDDRPQLVVESCAPTDPLYPVCDPEGDPLTIEFEVYAGTHPGPVPTRAPDFQAVVPAESTGTTVYQPAGASRLTEDTWYHWRIRVSDATSWSDWSGYAAFLVNADPPSPEFFAPFAMVCADLVLSVAPNAIGVDHHETVGGEQVVYDLEIADHGQASPPGVPTISILGFPQDASGSGTLIPIDSTALTEGGHHEVRARRWVGTHDSVWSSCDFWLDTANCTDANCAPGAISILSPSAGTEFPFDTTRVIVTVQNASDPQWPMPGAAVSIALCASEDQSFSDCDANPANWQLTPSTGDPSQTTEVEVTQLTDGTLLGPGVTVYVQACALDERDECGPADSTDFVIAGTDLERCGGLYCPSGWICEVSSGRCVEPPPCHPGCAEGEFCEAGTCVADPCYRVVCEEGSTCNRNAQGVCSQDEIGDCFGCPCCSAVCPTREGGWLSVLLILGLGVTRWGRGASPGRRRSE